MTMEERYYELREQMDRAWDAYCANRTQETLARYQSAEAQFSDFCVDVLDALMDENADVLKNLKGF